MNNPTLRLLGSDPSVLLAGYAELIRAQYPESLHRQVYLRLCEWCGAWSMYSYGNDLNRPPCVELVKGLSEWERYACGECLPVATSFPTLMPTIRRIIAFHKALMMHEMYLLKKELEAKLELEEGIRNAARKALDVSEP